MLVKLLLAFFIVSLVGGQQDNMTPWAYPKLKAGSCPPLSTVRVCQATCGSDADCAGPTKCCATYCGGSVCTVPVTQRRDMAQEKPGVCPLPGGPWVCSNRCSADSDCRGRTKCCKNRCGARACSIPLEL